MTVSRALMSFPGCEAFRDHLRNKYPAFSLRNDTKVVLVGAAAEGMRFLSLAKAHGIKVVAVCDGNPEKIGQQFEDYVVSPIDAATSFGPDTPIVIASHKPLDSTVRLRVLGARNVAPFGLLQVINPDLFPPHMFYAGWAEDLVENRDRYFELAALLADERSVSTLDAILQWRLSFDVAHLASVIDPDQYLSRSLVRFSSTDVFLDGGAFDGDTISQFIQECSGRFERVLAFEPDPVTFERLKANFAQDPRVEPINMGLHRKRSTLRFVNDGSRAAKLSGEGDLEVPVIGIDEALNGHRVDYIKLNIEGAEIDALYGGANSIAKYRPMLAISAYHSPDHLWRVAHVIREIEPAYRFYLRQQDGGAVEAVMYGIGRQSA